MPSCAASAWRSRGRSDATYIGVRRLNRLPSSILTPCARSAPGRHSTGGAESAVMNAADAARDIVDIYALAPMQQGMLFHTLYAPASGVYVEQMTCLLRGSLDVAAFREAWGQVIP